MAIEIVASVARSLRDAVWPPACVGCGDRLRDPDRTVCPSCTPILARVDDPTCRLCALPFPGRGSDISPVCSDCRRRSPPQEEGFAYWRYEGAVRQGIQRAKYGSERWRLRRLARPMRGWCRSLAERLRPPGRGRRLYVTVVPMHPNALADRGFSASLLLARTAFSNAPIFVDTGVLNYGVNAAAMRTSMQPRYV